MGSEKHKFTTSIRQQILIHFNISVAEDEEELLSSNVSVTADVGIAHAICMSPLQ